MSGSPHPRWLTASRGWVSQRAKWLMPTRLLQKSRLSCAAAMWSPFFPMAVLAASMKSCRSGWKNCAACNAHDQPRGGVCQNIAGADFLDCIHSTVCAGRISLDAHHRQDRVSLLGRHVAGVRCPKSRRCKSETCGFGKDRSRGHLHLYVEPCFQSRSAASCPAHPRTHLSVGEERNLENPNRE